MAGPVDDRSNPRRIRCPVAGLAPAALLRRRQPRAGAERAGPARDGPQAHAAIRAGVSRRRRRRRSDAATRTRSLCRMALHAAAAGGRIAPHDGGDDPGPARGLAPADCSHRAERAVPPRRGHGTGRSRGRVRRAVRAEHHVERPDAGGGQRAEPAPLVAAVRVRRRRGLAGVAAARRRRGMRGAGADDQRPDLRQPGMVEAHAGLADPAVRRHRVRCGAASALARLEPAAPRHARVQQRDRLHSEAAPRPVPQRPLDPGTPARFAVLAHAGPDPPALAPALAGQGHPAAGGRPPPPLAHSGAPMSIRVRPLAGSQVRRR